MIRKRAANTRGHFDHGWLKTYHTFSFADYYDPRNMGFHSLRVINEDWVMAGQGFGTHPHRDMEIVTYILEGALEHKDSMGNGSIIRPGDVQRMSAGTGITHSEFNPSKSEAVHLLQIWIMPNRRGFAPTYEQVFVSEADRTNKLRLISGPEGSGADVTIQQDAKMFSSFLETGSSVSYSFAPGRAGFLQVAGGSLTVGGLTLEHGDSAEIEGETSITIKGESAEKAHFVLFDLA